MLRVAKQIERRGALHDVAVLHDGDVVAGLIAGLRDDGMLESARERPQNKWHYEQAHLAELAASYAFGLAKNHPFVDGNKRIAFMTMVVFLRKNGVQFAPDQAQATSIIISLAAGEVSEESLTRWIRDNWPNG